MGICRACGGVLGRDCYNEQDCLEISNRQYFQDEQIIYQLEEYISVLKYRLEIANIPVPDIVSPEPALIFKIESSCENKYIDDGLPW